MLARLGSRVEKRSGLSWNDYQRLFQQFAFNGNRYISPAVTPTE